MINGPHKAIVRLYFLGGSPKEFEKEFSSYEKAYRWAIKKSTTEYKYKEIADTKIEINPITAKTKFSKVA